MNKEILIGAHLSYKKDTQLLGTIKDAIEIGATSGAFYISNSRSYNKFEQNLDLVKQAKELALKNNINLNNFIVHSPLVGNLANTVIDSDIYEKTFNSYLADLKMMEKANIKYFNFHPGSSADRIKGIKQVANAINDLHSKTKNDSTIILLETMMKKGNFIGVNFEELNEIISLVKDKTRVGVCIDTCHVWDAGYDIKNNLDGVLREFDNTIGLKFLKGLHINDSKNKLGSHVDRHQAIGKGYIGLKALRELVHHPKLFHLPKALETPYGNDDFRRWKDEIELLIG
ncbi:MAG: putative endonuclease 4 [Candidatus Tyloplasma litorale]|nr:MAG: putative endonuclease 4 [Mycoplasmatales bacterium]